MLTVRAAAGLDKLVATALTAALLACVEVPAIEADAVDGVQMRLRRPVAALLGVTRGDRVGDDTRARCDIEFVVRGEPEERDRPPGPARDRATRSARIDIVR